VFAALLDAFQQSATHALENLPSFRPTVHGCASDLSIEAANIHDCASLSFKPVVCALTKRSERHWVKRSFVPHTENNDAVHHLRDDEMDQAEGGSWVFYIISTIIAKESP
jgi:hypothetical protein